MKTSRRLLVLSALALTALGAPTAAALADGATPDQQQRGSPTGTPSRPGDEPAHDQPADSRVDQPPIVDSDPAEAPLTAADVTSAPRPGAEHGRVDQIDRGDGVLRVLGRIILWIPRIPLEVVLQPIRGAIYLQERYHVIHQVKQVFISDDGKFGLYPTAFRETGFGLNVGARAFVRNILGRGEKFSVRVGFGGQTNRIAAADLDSGKRISRYFSAGVAASIENRNRDRFFGYGNKDDAAEKPTGPPVDVRDPASPSYSTRFEMSVARVVPRIRINLPGHVTIKLSGALAKKTFAGTDDTVSDVSIEKAYDTSDNRLPGFARGTTYLYTEAEVAYDTRRPYDHWDAPAIRGTGGLAMGFFGRQTGLRPEDPDFYRVGVDLQRYIRLTPGPRVLSLRYYGELVTGDRDEVPFTELPRLGGVDLLRGYVTNRFRDKVAMVGQVGYQFLIGRQLAGSVFFDAGRVYDELKNVDLSGLRVGYGISLEAYSSRGLIVQATVVSALEGGVSYFFTFNPVSDARSRAERY